MASTAGENREATSVARKQVDGGKREWYQALLVEQRPDSKNRIQTEKEENKNKMG